MDTQVWIISDISRLFVIIRHYSVVVTDMPTIAPTPASWSAASKSQTPSAQIHLPNSHPLCYTLKTHELAPSCMEIKSTNCLVYECMRLSYPLSLLPSEANCLELKSIRFSFFKVSKSLILCVLSELIQTQEKRLGRSSVLC